MAKRIPVFRKGQKLERLADHPTNLEDAAERIKALTAEIADLKRQLASSLAVIRENRFGANSPDLEDAVRQVLQAAIAEADNAKEAMRQLAEAHEAIGYLQAVENAARKDESRGAELQFALASLWVWREQKIKGRLDAARAGEGK